MPNAFRAKLPFINDDPFKDAEPVTYAKRFVNRHIIGDEYPDLHRYWHKHGYAHAHGDGERDVDPASEQHADANGDATHGTDPAG